MIHNTATHYLRKDRTAMGHWRLYWIYKLTNLHLSLSTTKSVVQAIMASSFAGWSKLATIIHDTSNIAKYRLPS